MSDDELPPEVQLECLRIMLKSRIFQLVMGVFSAVVYLGVLFAGWPWPADTSFAQTGNTILLAITVAWTAGKAEEVFWRYREINELSRSERSRNE